MRFPPLPPVGADTGWFVAPSGLVYALRDGTNHATVGVEMIDGHYFTPATEAFGGRLVALLNGDEVHELDPVGTDAPWLIDGSAIYALRGRTNHCMFRVGMVEGGRDAAKTSAFAQQIFERLQTLRG